MAVDRAIDSTEFDSKLTTVADAIRTAGGTTEPMSFPSGMVEAISALKSGSEAGGGGGIVKGTFTLASAQGDYGFAEIQDNILNPPDVILLYKTDYTEDDYSWLIAVSVKIADKFYQVALRNNSSRSVIKSSTSDLYSSSCIRIEEFPRPAHLSCYMTAYYMQPGTYEYMYYWL